MDFPDYFVVIVIVKHLNHQTMLTNGQSGTGGRRNEGSNSVNIRDSREVVKNRSLDTIIKGKLTLKKRFNYIHSREDSSSVARMTSNMVYRENAETPPTTFLKRSSGPRREN